MVEEVSELRGITELPGIVVVEPPLTSEEAINFETELARHKATLHILYQEYLARRGVELLSDGEDKEGNQFFLAMWNDVKFMAVSRKEDRDE
jgi:hypothetical protein